MDEKQIDNLLRKALEDERRLPEGLSQRLEEHIDRLAANEKRRKASLFKQRVIYASGSVAAAILISIALFFQTGNIQTGPVLADTFTNPEEAAVAASEALVIFSTQFNKGMKQVSNAGQEIHKVNHILSRQFSHTNINQ